MTTNGVGALRLRVDRGKHCWELGGSSVARNEEGKLRLGMGNGKCAVSVMASG